MHTLSSNNETILFIGAHHEEIEAECPILPLKLSGKGHRVVILDPVGGWNWSFIRGLGADGKERTINEAEEAASRLGCEKIIWDYPVAKVWEFRSEILQRMSDFILSLEPSIVFIHWPYDTHADHREIAKISLHALRSAKNLTEDFRREMKVKEVYAFQTGIGQAYNFWPDFTVTGSEDEYKTAAHSLEAFHGTAKDNAKIWLSNVNAKAGYWGAFSGVEHAEAYKFIGPSFPLKGLKLASILGDEIKPASYERWQREQGYLI